MTMVLQPVLLFLRGRNYKRLTLDSFEYRIMCDEERGSWRPLNFSVDFDEMTYGHKQVQMKSMHHLL